MIAPTAPLTQLMISVDENQAIYLNHIHGRDILVDELQADANIPFSSAQTSNELFRSIKDCIPDVAN